MPLTWGIGLAVTALLWSAAAIGFALGWAIRARLGARTSEDALDEAYRRGMEDTLRLRAGERLA